LDEPESVKVPVKVSYKNQSKEPNVSKEEPLAKTATYRRDDLASKETLSRSAKERQANKKKRQNNVAKKIVWTIIALLLVTLAVTALKRGQVKRIILTRPAVEAGESLGFLPGDLKEKVDPYLRPVYDALYQILGKDQTTRLMEREIIEIAPLAYMRGRTLDDAFVILDEAQNTTIMQMKMFLTRLGFHSKMIVNGDISQIDLPRNVKSGLIDAQEKLKNIHQIDFVHFSAKDVVRHPVVAQIIRAYEPAPVKKEESEELDPQPLSEG